MTTHPSIDELLYTDLDGNSGADPDEVVLLADEDDRHLERVPALVALMEDTAAKPYDRFQACYALARWAEQAGYDAVIAAASAPAAVVWSDYSIDRFYSTDDTFAQLADAVGSSDELAERKGTEELRLTALRALIRIADQVYFERNLEYALDRRTLPAVLDEIPPVVRRGAGRIADRVRDRLPFDLAAQLAGLVSAVTPVDEALAVRLADALVDTDPGDRALTELTGLVNRGATPASLDLAERLRYSGSADVRQAVADALRNRDLRSRG